MMNEVGQHLQVEAQSKTGVLKDQFARSAYNRYYYANFLAAREMYMRLFPGASSPGHAAYPEMLRGKIVKPFRDARFRARKAGDSKLVAEIEKAISACLDLASQFEKANDVRKIADYKPEVKVSFSTKERFSLSSTNITEAHQWIEKTDALIIRIERTWKRVSAI